MAESQDGSPDAPKPPPAAIPDLKKALENKPAPFAWAPGAARSAASAPLVGAPAKAPSALDRLNTTPGRLAALAVLMLIGGVALSFTAFQDRAGGGGGDLGGVKSTIKSRAFQGRDSVGFSKGYGAGNDPAAAGKSGMNFDLIKAGEKALAAGIPEMPGVPGCEAPMNYDEGAASRAGAAGGAAAGKDGAAGGEDAAGGGLAGGAAPKLGSSYGKINFQGMRRVSGTAGFRGIKANTPSKTIKTRGSAASSTGAEGAAGRGGGGTATAPLTPFSGNASRAGASSAGAAGAGAAAGAGGGGSGGGGALDIGELESSVDQNLPSIPDLMAQAASKREDADKEEKRAKILAAGGHFPQAHYHYDRAQKRKKEADDLEDQANQQLNAIKVEADGINEQDPP